MPDPTSDYQWGGGTYGSGNWGDIVTPNPVTDSEWTDIYPPTLIFEYDGNFIPYVPVS